MRVGLALADRPKEVGGGYTYENEVLRGVLALADSSNHEFVVFTNQPANGRDGSERISFLPFARESKRDGWLRRIKLKSAIARTVWPGDVAMDKAAKRAGVDLVWFVGANGVWTDLPYVATVWDLQHRLQPWFPEVSAGGQWDQRELFYSWFLQRAAFVVTGNEAGKSEVEKFYAVPGDRIRLLPHMVPGFALDAPARGNVDLAQRYGLTRPFVFYPAQFWAHKNHVNLMLALKQLAEHHGLALDAVFVGSDHGNLAHLRDTATRLGMQERVHFLGFIPQEDMVELYRNALALTYMSFFGPENLPPLEAFALGCPVIAANVSGAEEQLGDGAILVDPRDPGAIAEAIRAVAQDPGLRDGLVARAGSRRRYTAEDYARDMFRVLDEFEPVRRCWGQ